jgi:hypothetical protein
VEQLSNRVVCPDGSRKRGTVVKLHNWWIVSNPETIPAAVGSSDIGIGPFYQRKGPARTCHQFAIKTRLFCSVF